MSNGIWAVALLALLPALGNFGGGLLSEWRPPLKRVLNRALHAAGGVILAVVTVEVMPRALGAAPAWLLALAFVTGGVAYLLIEACVERWQSERQGGAGAGAWVVYVAVATDLVGDGLLIGGGSALSIQLALVLALGQVLVDIPEGFAVIANFRDKGVGRMKRLLISASFAVPVVGSALLAYFVRRGQGEVMKMSALVFVAGLYLLAAVEDMLREAHQRKQREHAQRPDRDAGADTGTPLVLFHHLLKSDAVRRRCRAAAASRIGSRVASRPLLERISNRRSCSAGQQVARSA